MNRKTEGILVIIIALAVLLGAFMFLGLDTPIILIIVCLVALGIGISIIVDGNKTVRTNSSRSEDEIVDSKTLHEEMNQERKRHGESELPAINPYGGTSTNNLARRDKSWSSVPDFFIKLGKGKK